ncbi:amino acid-binding protein [Parasporobacterium paucivorans]|uniref:Uncharacterized conserved protein, contains tandem ACT domains n=1 Tax=Parasporobacterium paucivorans DSM 15970 TaxID=1122934 RepID=A0A1M6DNH1_9FIRM|nr:amino acid-binding protein [Parasporobacterium paucivorans]SHI74689.1 Uncharacterized conserved protein, contains tandem ACT domains [Parasporobacterium paucivorans DSM 15970]
MCIKQLAVFMENREGRLDNVIKTLHENQVDIISFSLADTTEYGMLRMVVSDPEKARLVLKENGFSSMLTDVLAVKMSDYFRDLNKLLEAVSGAGLNIEYMYVLSTVKGGSAIITKFSDAQKALQILDSNNITVYTFEEIMNLGK